MTTTTTTTIAAQVAALSRKAARQIIGWSASCAALSIILHLVIPAVA